MYFCPHCTKQIDIPLPVEPVYGFDTVKLLVPANTDTSLRSMIQYHKDSLSPPVYRRDGKGKFHRMYTASDVRFLRDRIIKSGFFRSDRNLPPRKPKEEYFKLKQDYLDNKLEGEKFYQWRRRTEDGTK